MNTSQQHKTFLLKEIGNLPLITFEPAALCEFNSGWIIEYRILNPITGRLERQRIKFQKIRKRQRNDQAARKVGKTYCNAINEKLESGWTPYNDLKNSKTFHKLTDVLKAFINDKELDYKNKILRYDSIRTYRSQLSMLLEWISKENASMQVVKFDKETGQRYLDYVYRTKEVSPRTWNNYLVFLRTLWAWMVENNYCSENVFQKIKPKAKTEKERVIIPEHWSNKIITYFRQNNPVMELICGLVYNSFMRPSEICRTQLKNIHLESNAIYLPGDKTKNSHSRWCLLPPHLSELIRNMHLEKYSDNNYLISTGLKPGKTKVKSWAIDKEWIKMRSVIDLPTEMKLYSYRDTGITDLKKQGFSNLFISTITGHLNSEEIETYTHAPDPKALGFVLEKSKKL
jgi:integrase